MRINNLQEVTDQLKPYLKQYLEQHDTTFIGGHFTCPNRKEHRNEDNKPACSFYPDEEHFHCFVCNKSGDIFTAVSMIEGLPVEGRDFIETTIELASRYGISVQSEEDTADVEGKKLRGMLALIRDAAHKTYLITPEAKKYVEERQLTNIEVEAKFGWCNYDKLVTFLATKGYTETDITNAGLSRMLLHERLLIPVHDSWNRIVAFGSRKTKNDISEKYYNSSTSQIYKKSEVLFNFNNAKNFETVFIVEGYMDVWGLVRVGIKNVVALCGTALSEQHIQALVKNKVKKVILCLDGDGPGQEAMNTIIDSLAHKDEFTVSILQLKDGLDPDDFIKKFGVEEFQKQEQRSIFDFKLQKYIESNLDKSQKETILKYVSDENSFIEKEHMCKKLAKAASVKVETVISEIDRIEREKLGDYGVTTQDKVNEKDSLSKEIFLFEQWANTRGKLLGLNIAQFPIMTEKLDGIQNGMYVIAAEENTGKSALTCSLMLNLTLSNPGKVFVLYFGLDVSNRTLVARMISNISGVAINAVSNPRYGILEKAGIVDAEGQLRKRSQAIQQVRELVDSLSIKDEKTVRSIEDMERLIKVYQDIHRDKQLVVIIDSLNQMSTSAKKETRDIFMYISDKIKEWTVKFDIPVFAISELRKLNHPGMRPTNDDIKEVSDLKYDADCTILLYNEMHSDRENSQRTFVGDSGIVYPIVEGIVFKNKLSGFKGSFWWRFYTDLSKYEECTREEVSRILGIQTRR